MPSRELKAFISAVQRDNAPLASHKQPDVFFNKLSSLINFTQRMSIILIWWKIIALSSMIQHKLNVKCLQTENTNFILKSFFNRGNYKQKINNHKILLSKKHCWC